jgi:tetratricopeptide (TPR) repeat protein
VKPRRPSPSTRAARAPIPAPEAAADPGPAPAAAAADLGARAVWVALAGLALARAAAAFVPGTWGWGLDAQRFVAPLPGWTLWALAALALVPALARRLAPGIQRLGDAPARAPAASAAVWAAGAALLAWVLPDRLQHLGDFRLRLTGFETPGVTIATWGHVVLPLDVLLHDRLTRLLHAGLGLGWTDAMRVLGVIEAGALGALASRFAGALGLRGAAAFASTSIVLFGGYLTLFTGYNKAFMETCLATLALTVAALELLRGRDRLLPLGIAAAAAFAAHRSGLALLPPLALAWARAGRARGPAAGAGRALGIAGIVLPLATLAALAPDMLAAMKRYDGPVFAPPGPRGGMLASAFAPGHLLDVANLALQLSPLVIVTPALLAWSRAWRRREAWLFLALLLPNLALLLFVHARQGAFRDLDCFAAPGMALALVTAWLVGIVIEHAPARRWVAVAVALGVAVPAVQWLMLPADPERGLARVRAFVEEPPRRDPSVRAETWDFLGIRAFRLERWREGAEAFERAAETAPSARILSQWALCAANLHDFAMSESLYRRVTVLDSTSALAWHGLMGSAFQLRHLAGARSAARKVLERAPGDPDALDVLDIVGRAERADSARAAQGDSIPRAARTRAAPAR